MNAERIAAELYDQTVVDWPGELEFYETLAAKARTVLEVACGTGRVGLRLATAGRRVLGFDISPHMIAVAKTKGQQNPDADWQVGDMRDFEFSRRFDLIIVPGHSFQFMLGIPDQLSCLQAIRRHLTPTGSLVVHVDHQDLAWLGSLPEEAQAARVATSDVRLPGGRMFRVARRWSYHRATQTASAVTAFEELGEGGTVLDRAERAPVHLHCFFRYEMELLWRQAGFEMEALYGDFTQSELDDESSEMILLMRWPAGS